MIVYREQAIDDIGLVFDPMFEKGDIVEYIGGDWYTDLIRPPGWDGTFEVDELRLFKPFDDIEYTAPEVGFWIPEQFLRKVG